MFYTGLKIRRRVIQTLKYSHLEITQVGYNTYQIVFTPTFIEATWPHTALAIEFTLERFKRELAPLEVKKISGYFSLEEKRAVHIIAIFSRGWSLN
jgi:hypothetical protein